MLSSGKAPHQVSARIIPCGNDLLVCIEGGDSPHIGAVALGIPRPGLSNPTKTSASASVLCVTGHKEDELARSAALRLSSHYNCRVVITVGIHIDDAQPEDLAKLETAFQKLLNKIAEAGARA